MAKDNLIRLLFYHVYLLFVLGFCLIIFAKWVSAAADELITSNLVRLAGAMIVLLSVVLFLCGHR